MCLVTFWHVMTLGLYASTCVIYTLVWRNDSKPYTQGMIRNLFSGLNRISFSSSVCWFWTQPLSVFIYACFADWVLHIIAHFGFASYSKSRVWTHQQTSQILERTISWVNSGLIPPWFTQHQKPMAVEMWPGQRPKKLQLGLGKIWCSTRNSCVGRCSLGAVLFRQKWPKGASSQVPIFLEHLQLPHEQQYAQSEKALGVQYVSSCSVRSLKASPLACQVISSSRPSMAKDGLRPFWTAKSYLPAYCRQLLSLHSSRGGWTRLWTCTELRVTYG